MEGRNESDAGRMTPSELQRNVQPPTQRTTVQVTSELDYSLEWEDSFGRFEENKNYLSDRLEYARPGNEPGLVLIFNQETFENGEPKRDGSLKDVGDIVTCLSRLGFNVRSDNIFTNLTNNEIFRNVDRVLASDLSQYNSVLVFVLTHGGDSNFLSSRTAYFLAEDFWLKFVNCSSLEGKPKMFVIQACKGKEYTRFTATTQDTFLVPLSTFSCQRIYPDMLIVYSTMEGKYSFRHNTNGTWLIQELCKNFTAYGRRDDVMTLLSRVIKCICKNYYEEKNSEVVKQIPVVVSTLSKKFYLNKNKDRHLVLSLLDKQDVILKMTNNIYETVKFIHGSDDKKNSKEKSKNTAK